MVYSSTREEPNQHKEAGRKKIRVPDIVAAKGIQKISCVTCYDATFARLVEKSKIDLVLVGDSLGNVMQGKGSTIPVTVDDIVYHTRCVANALKTPLLVADMPFAAAGLVRETCFRAAEAFLRAGAEAVKIEGASAEICEQISCLTRHGIPVQGHLGLVPQSVHALGGFRVQGKTEAARERIIAEAKALQDAGCFSIVLELVTPEVSAAVTEVLSIPTIGIGAGANCDGQILVLQDMLGMNSDFKPKFLRHFAELEGVVVGALNSYASEVANSTFP